VRGRWFDARFWFQCPDEFEPEAFQKVIE
jgi:hypothetical protein